MAKLGMPSVTISFIEAGIEAIQRSQRGIVALLLEESQETIEKLLTDHTGSDEETTIKAITNPFTVYTTDDIPTELTDDNKDYITKCLIGYTKSPYRVKVYLQATDEAEVANADKFAETLKTLSTDRMGLPGHSDDCDGTAGICCNVAQDEPRK